jgi:peptide/nickel transport system substrate-binding protein
VRRAPRPRSAARALRAAAAAAAALLAAAAPRAAAGVRPAYGGTVRLTLPTLPREADPALAAEPADVFLARATGGLLLELDPAGRLAPGLLAEVPAAEAEGRAFRLRVDPAARTASGAPVLAADVARVLARLLSPASPSPHAWAALAISGADAALDGRAASPAGLQVLSEHELLVTLSAPLPEFPYALATSACAVPGAGAFAADALQPGRPVLLSANPHHPRGRPLADRLVLSAADARGAARLLERGEADGALRPEAAGQGARPLPALTATVAAVNAPRLGAAAPAVRDALAALDRAALARRFARGPAVPLATLIPAALLGGDAAAAAAAPPDRRALPAAPAGARALRLLVPEGAADARAAAERLQVLLFDRGLRAAVDAVPRATFAARAAAGDADVAIASVVVLAPRPSLAAAQVAHALRGADGARRALAALSGKEGAAAAEAAAALARDLDLFPLLASGARATASPRLQGLAAGGGGEVDPAGLWLLGGGAP